MRGHRDGLQETQLCCSCEKNNARPNINPEDEGLGERKPNVLSGVERGFAVWREEYERAQGKEAGTKNPEK